jgi:Gpi18-like mannosyltransferase
MRLNKIFSMLGKSEIKALTLLILLSFTLRVLLFSVQGCEIDLKVFSYWFKNAADYGPRNFYDVGWCDYPPFNVYIFWIFGSVAKQLSLFGTDSIVYVLKMPSTLADMGVIFLIFVFLRRRLDLKSSVILTSLYAFNPATIFNSAVWGQFDAIYTFFLLLSLVLLLDFGSPELSAISYTVGVLTKPQSIALAPLVFFMIIKMHGGRKLLISLLFSALTALLVVLTFRWDNPVDFLKNVYLRGYSYYSFTSINAFNFWALFGLWKPDTGPLPFLNLNVIGWIMFGVLAIFLLNSLNRRFDRSQEPRILLCAFLLFFGFFMLPTRIHERYLFPAFSVLVLLLPFISETRWIYGVLTFTFLFNQAYVMDFLNRETPIPDLDPFVYAISIINTVVFFYSISLVNKGKKVRGRFLNRLRRLFSGQGIRLETSKARESGQEKIIQQKNEMILDEKDRQN